MSRQKRTALPTSRRFWKHTVFNSAYSTMSFSWWWKNSRMPVVEKRMVGEVSGIAPAPAILTLPGCGDCHILLATMIYITWHILETTGASLWHPSQSTQYVQRRLWWQRLPPYQNNKGESRASSLEDSDKAFDELCISTGTESSVSNLRKNIWKPCSYWWENVAYVFSEFPQHFSHLCQCLDNVTRHKNTQANMANLNHTANANLVKNG